MLQVLGSKLNGVVFIETESHSISFLTRVRVRAASGISSEWLRIFYMPGEIALPVE